MQEDPDFWKGIDEEALKFVVDLYILQEDGKVRIDSLATSIDSAIGPITKDSLPRFVSVFLHFSMKNLTQIEYFIIILSSKFTLFPS